MQGRYRTRALIAGRGQPLILIHGTGGHLENYARNIEAYAKHFQVIAIDLLWHGRSQTDGFDEQLFPGFLAQIEDVMGCLAIDRAHIEGQSLGGWVAAQFAARNPSPVAKLVLVTAMGYAPASLGRIDYGAMGRDKLREANLAILENPVWENIRTRMSRILASPASLTDEAIAVRHALYNDSALNAVQRRVTNAYFSDAVAPFALTDAVLGPIRDVAAKLWPGVPVVPTLEPGASDAQYLDAIGTPTYGVTGLFTDPDGGRMHGLNERVRVQSVVEAREFLYRLIKRYAE